jgi:hypothetical protein
LCFIVISTTIDLQVLVLPKCRSTYGISAEDKSKLGQTMLKSNEDNSKPSGLIANSNAELQRWLRQVDELEAIGKSQSR